MFIGDNSQLENQIVTLLAEKHSASAKSIYTAIRAKRQVSIQGVYKELRKLLKQGVIWKKEKQYGLSASWILNVSELADKMYHTLSKSLTVDNTLPKPGEKTLFRFSSLARLDDFWIHLIFVLGQNSEEKILYQWMCHPWFNLIHQHKSFPLLKALKAEGICVKLSVSGNTFLDKKASMISRSGAYEYILKRQLFETTNKHYAVTDRYLFTMKIEEEVIEDICALYKNTSSQADYNAAEATSIVNQQCKIHASLECDTPQQQKIYKKLRKT